MEKKLVGIGISFFLPDFLIVGPITTNRIGFALILIGFFIGMNKSNIRFKIPGHVKKLLVSLAVFTLSVFLSTIFNMRDITIFTSWCLILVVMVILAFLLNSENNFFPTLGAAAYSSFAMLSILAIFSFSNYGFFAFMGYGLRSSINNLDPGLSRIVNGLVYANLIIYLNYISTRKFSSKFLFFISYFFSFWFSFSTHSRQGLLLLLLMAIPILYNLYMSISWKVLGIALVTVFSLTIRNLVINSPVFQERFVNRTFSQIDEGEGSTAQRLELYVEGFELFKKNFLFGIGSGKFIDVFDLDAHSGYLLALVEEGFFAAIAILLLLFSVKSVLKKLPGYGDFRMNMWILVTVILTAPIFNSLLKTPMFWSVMLLLFSIRAVFKRNQTLIRTF